MVSIQAYSKAIGLDVSIGDEFSSPVDSTGGVDQVGATLFVFELVNTAVDGVLNWFHRQRARRICRKLLEENSRTKALICAKCLFVYTRK